MSMGRNHKEPTFPSSNTVVAFRYSLPVLKIYSVRDVYCRFSVLAMNIGTQSVLALLLSFFIVH